MFDQLIIGAALVGITSVVQAAFMLSGFRALQALRAHERRFSHQHATLIIVIFVLYMFVAMIVEVVIWAAVLRWVGATRTFSDALYISTGSFTTIGHTGEVAIALRWRLLVAFEGVNGMIIFGWATALVVAAIQHFDVWPQLRRDAAPQRGGRNA
ncbi:MAG TPA: ion channel [Burkholderiales bacterium]